MRDPVHEYEGQWYFWDETWCARIGPYATKEEATKACYQYALEL